MNQNNPIEIAKLYKYNFWFLWQNLTRAEQNLARIELPKSMYRAWRTIESWMYITNKCEKMIPADSLYQLSTFFDVPVAKMWNSPPESLHLTRLKINNQLNQ